MMAAWELLKEDRPEMFSHGCSAHALNLLLQALFENIQQLGDFLAECVTVAKFVKTRQGLRARVGGEQFYQPHKRAVALPVPTRWYTQETCIESVIRNEVPLKRAFDDDTLMERYTGSRSWPDVDTSIRDHTFWAVGEIVLKITDPITDALAFLERDDTSVSKVNDCFYQLTQREMYTKPQYGLDTAIQRAILTEINARWRIVRREALVDVAYLLDPCLPLEDFVRDNMIEFIEKTTQLAKKTDALDEAVTRLIHGSISKIMEDKLMWSKDKRERNPTYTLTQWWKLHPQYMGLG